MTGYLYLFAFALLCCNLMFGLFVLMEFDTGETAIMLLDWLGWL